MKKSVRLSLRVRLLALVLLTLAPAFALIIYNAVEDSQRATAEVKTTALRLVRLAAQNHEQLIDDVHYTAEEMIGNPIMLLVPGNEIDRVAENFKRIERGERVGSYEADGIIALTALETPAQRETALSAGADRLVVKNRFEMELVPVIESLPHCSLGFSPLKEL